jgi:hypothetical protein
MWGGKITGIRVDGSISATVNDGNVMDVKTAADFLRISEAKLRRLVYDQRVPFFRIDGRILFFRPSVENWILTLIVQPVEESVETSARDAASTIWKTTRGER